jgi:hypothetical protein
LAYFAANAANDAAFGLMAMPLEGVLLQADFASPQHALLVLSLDAILSLSQQAPFVSAEALALVLSQQGEPAFALSQQAPASLVVAAVLMSAANSEAAKANAESETMSLFINN